MYEEMTYENLLDTMLDRVDDSLDKREGSIIYDAVAPTAYCLAKMYFELQHYADLVLPGTSAGEYLDRFAAAFNMERKDAVKAVRIGYFDAPVPEGSRFSTEGGESVLFRIISVPEKDGNRYVYQLECETAGQIGNEVEGKLLPVDYISSLGSAELGDIITEGTETESDEDFRKRMFEKIRKPSTSGNIHDYYNWSMECPGVGAAKVFPLWNGPGTVKVVIADENKAGAGQAVLNRVSEYIEERRPIGADVSVTSALEKKIDIFARVTLNKSVNLGIVQKEFHDNIEEYLRSNTFSIQYISIAKIGSLLMEISGVEDCDNLLLNGEEKNMAIAEEELLMLGTVSLEVM